MQKNSLLIKVLGIIMLLLIIRPGVPLYAHIDDRHEDGGVETHLEEDVIIDANIVKQVKQIFQKIEDGFNIFDTWLDEHLGINIKKIVSLLIDFTVNIIRLMIDFTGKLISSVSKK